MVDRAIGTGTTWNVCLCGRQKQTSQRNCGQCPQRRASEAEIDAASEQGKELPPCVKCGALLTLAIGATAPSPEASHALTCLECQRNKQEACQCPKHIGGKLVPAIAVSAYSWQSRSYRSKDTVSKLRCCVKCAMKYRLQTWLEYSESQRSIDHETGEVLPLFGTSGALKLESDPFYQYGGFSRVWCCSRGAKGTWRVVNGVAERPWIAFLPHEFAYARIRGVNTRYIVATEYDPHTIAAEKRRAVLHSSINSELDKLLKPEGSQYSLNVASLGWCYARVCGLAPGSSETHHVYLSLYRDHEGVSLSEWIRDCHATQWNENEGRFVRP